MLSSYSSWEELVQQHDISVSIIVSLFKMLLFSILQIMKEINENKIKIYEFPEIEEDEETKENKKLAVGCLPLTHNN